jgi:hypothetical protein
MDACGNSIQEAWANLKDSLTMYITMEKEVAGNSTIATAKIITQAAFADSEQKKRYIAIYRETKLAYTLYNLESGKHIDPIQEERLQLERLVAEGESICSIINELKVA